MLAKAVLLFFFIHCLSAIVAQQANTWYFGSGAGLDFNTSPPTPLTNGAMSWAPEGSSVVSDSTGKLLFYTNGEYVWNRNHQLMPNGSGIKGHISSTQSSIIIPKPGSKFLYYILTSDAGENGINPNGYCYSVVDLTLDNGLGDITEKNVLLYKPSTEKLTAIKHANGIDYWIITKEINLNNRYRAYLLTCNGLNTTSSSVVFSTLSSGIFNTPNTYGYLKVSPDGRKIIDVTPHWNSFAGDNRTGFNLYEFNNGTGTLYNNLRIPFSDAAFTFYGAEFSPNSKLVYLSGAGTLAQFDLNTYDSLSIQNSVVVISATHPSLTLALQLGPDARIYVATAKTPRDSVLGIIQNPDIKGSGCSYIQRAIDLGGKKVLMGLPNFPVNLVSNREIDFRYTAQQTCNTFLFSGSSNLDGSLNWIWDFGDGTLGQGQQVVHTFPLTSTVYTVTLNIVKDIGCRGLLTKTLQVPLAYKTASADFQLLQYCTSPAVNFFNTSTDTPVVISGYEWDFGDGITSREVNPEHNYSAFGTYSVRLKTFSTDPCAISGMTEKDIIISPKFNRSFAGNDTSIVRGAFLQLDGRGGTACTWYPPQGLFNPDQCNPIVNTNNNMQQIQYFLNVITTDSCIGTDSIKIKLFNSADIFVPSAFTPNGDGLNDFLFPILVGIKELLFFRVYDRWGNIVFRTGKSTGRWNGTIGGATLNSGVFVWVAEGVTTDGRRIKKSGSTSLLR